MRTRIAFARNLRRESTDAERALWRQLRGRRFQAVKFRRQAPIGPYIVDFVSFEIRLVLEIDGGHHARDPQKRKDIERDRWLRDEGFTVLRFWDTEVLQQMQNVLEVIYRAVPDERKPR